MTYKCIIKHKTTNDVYESDWQATEAQARRQAWGLTGQPKGNIGAFTKSHYAVKVESREL